VTKNTGYVVNLSLVVLSRNEEDIMSKNLTIISNYMKQLTGVDEYEIVISDKSEDSTPSIVRNMIDKDSKIRYTESKNKGVGAGIKNGIDEARYEYVLIYQIDMGFKIDVIKRTLETLLQGYDLVYASRYVKGSNVVRPLQRRIFSFANRIVVRILFNVKIKDLNGVYGMKKSKITQFRHLLEADDGFLPTEIAIYGRKNNLKIIEIPVDVHDMRNSSLSWIIKIASKTFENAIRKRIKLWKEDIKGSHR
jgi:hypothetical protein